MCKYKTYKYSYTLKILLFILTCLKAYQIQNIISQQQKISSYINQSKSIQIPFKRCFKISTSFEQNKKYLSFKPNSITLLKQVNSQISQKSQNNLINELRSPSNKKHKNLLVFDSYVMLYSLPNLITIFQQKKNTFQKVHQYRLNELQYLYDQPKMYKFGNYACLTLNSEIYILSKLNYTQFKRSDNSHPISSFAALENNNEFVVSEHNTIIHYKVDFQAQKLVQINKVTLKKSFQLQKIMVRRIQSQTIIYYLDLGSGLLQTSLNLTNTKQLFSIKNCYTFDSLNEQNFVFLCRMHEKSTMIEIKFFQKQDKFKIIGTPDYLHIYLYNIEATLNFNIIFTRKHLIIIWKSQLFSIQEHENIENKITLNGLSAYSIFRKQQQIYIYTVESNYIKKYKIKQSKAQLYIFSKQIIQRKIKIYMYGNCNELQNIKYEKDQKLCSIQKQIQFNAKQLIESRDQDYTLSFIIIIMLFIIFFLIIWICFKKYHYLEKEARKVLENYKKKKNNHRRPI